MTKPAWAEGLFHLDPSPTFNLLGSPAWQFFLKIAVPFKNVSLTDRHTEMFSKKIFFSGSGWLRLHIGIVEHGPKNVNLLLKFNRKGYFGGK